ncbi:MAG: stage V sporulation protein AD, partial [Clostridia bacterium]|nr:stage V sporulation protein AD [Clostridia bacterium]
MSQKRLGSQTVKFESPVSINSVYSIVGPKEGEGPLGKYFDYILEDEFWGEKTWEKSETKVAKECVANCISKVQLSYQDINYLLAGDLINQCTPSSFGSRDTNIPFLGLFGACSTFVEGMSIGSMLIDGGYADNIVCATSSHFCSAEKQFRFPLELGNQRPPSAQWTVTGSGSALLSNTGNGPYVTHVTTGKIVDMGIKDANNMGSAMAPAAADTMYMHFKDTGRAPSYYDMILTGDLGHIGKSILVDLMESRGYNIKSNYNDCGVLMFDKEKQDTHAGGSGCACCATTFCGYIYKQLQAKKIKKVLLIATGALMSPTTAQQSESIPGIAHAVSI